MSIVRDREPFSYLRDGAIPEFRTGGVLTVMDAHCSLCARGAAWIARNDTAEEFTIIPLQSPVDMALMRHYGLDPADPVSWLYLEDGRAYSSLDALVRVGWRLGGLWKGLIVLRVLPHRLQDVLYRIVARNRYRLFGTTDLCSLPDPEVRKRLLS